MKSFTIRRPEKSIDRAIGLMIKKRFPAAWAEKFSDKFKSGIPDRLGCLGGVFFAIEVKAFDGIVSPIQRHVLEEIRNAGGVTCVAKDVPFAEEFLRDIESGRLKGGDHRER